MNLQHFWAVLWLSWRLQRNQLRRGGAANVVILVIIVAMLSMATVGMLIGGFFVGWLVLGDVPTVVLLLVWDGLAVAFLFFWLIGLMAELQRSEVLSLNKFLHLPISLTGVFVINYLCSLLRVSLIVFVPAMIGLTVGLTISRGPRMLWLFPLIAAFVLMISALTYQFQGWLAALMSNPRRRRTVVVIATLSIVLISQLPNLANFMIPRDRGPKPPAGAQSPQRQELQRQLTAKEITPAQHQQRLEDLRRAEKDERDRKDKEELQSIGQTAELVSAVFPPGWLPLGAMAAGDGGVLIPFATILGLSLVGAGSLWRAYRTTVRIYTGHFSGKPGKKAQAKRVEQPWDGRPILIEKQLPLVSEQTSAVALASYRSILRAPEAKLLLLAPFILIIVFGSMLFTRGESIPAIVGTLLPYGAIMMTLISFSGLSGNLFGFDRSGFRVFVLSPASRRDILLGKNLAVAPFALGIAWGMILLIQIFKPMRFDLLLSMIPQSFSMLLIFSLLSNWLSIFAAMPIKAGSLKPVKPHFSKILIQLAFLTLMPMAMAPIMIPLGLDALMPNEGWSSHVPVCLILSIAECALVVFLYHVLLKSQGDLLQAREQAILEVVTKTD